MNLNPQIINSSLRLSLIESVKLTSKSTDGRVSTAFLLVLNDRKQTNFMQCADVFSPSKALVKIVTHATPLYLPSQIVKVVEQFVNAFSSDQYELIYAIPIGLEEFSHVNKKYRELSDGRKSTTAHSFLSAYRVPHKTDENLFIL